ncbi:MAG: sensor domain-containing diguanylate cyclase [Arcobacteraceae bacterium]
MYQKESSAYAQCHINDALLSSIVKDINSLDLINKGDVFNSILFNIIKYCNCDSSYIYFYEPYQREFGKFYSFAKPQIEPMTFDDISNLTTNIKRIFKREEIIDFVDIERLNSHLSKTKYSFIVPIYSKDKIPICYIEIIYITEIMCFSKEQLFSFQKIFEELINNKRDMIHLHSLNNMYESIIKSFYHIPDEDTSQNHKINLIKNLKVRTKVFDKIKMGITIADEHGSIIDVNQAFCDITGYHKQELVGQNPSILQSKWHDKTFYEKMWSDINKKGFFEGEILDRRKNGELYVSHIMIYAIKNQNNGVENYLAFTEDITSKKEQETKIANMAFYDPLTNLANRNYLKEEVQKTIKESLRNNQKFVLMFLDLDGFKAVNDTYGHLIGDKVLKYVASIIKKSVRESDFISRIGGDEFIILFKNLDDMYISNIASKIIGNISKEFEVDGNYIKIGCSIGIGVFPKNGTTIEELINNADSAMYKSKKEGKNRFTFHV